VHAVPFGKLVDTRSAAIIEQCLKPVDGPMRAS